MNIASLSEKDFFEIDKYYASQEPKLFWKLQHPFKNPKTLIKLSPPIIYFVNLFENSNASTVINSFKEFLAFLEDFSPHNFSDLLQISATYFPFWNCVQDIYKETRGDIGNDGWFANYRSNFIPLTAENIPSNLKSKEYLYYAYRLMENKQKEAAIQLLKRYHVSFVKVFMEIKKRNYNSIRRDVFLFIELFLIAYQEYLKLHINKYMPLFYLTQKKKYINKIYKKNKFGLFNLFSLINKNFGQFYDYIFISPQHLFKLIYIYTERHKINKTTRSIEELFELIQYSIKYFASIYDNAPSPVLLINVIMEFYFVIFYILENIYYIDPRDIYIE